MKSEVPSSPGEVCDVSSPPEKIFDVSVSYWPEARAKAYENDMSPV